MVNEGTNDNCGFQFGEDEPTLRKDKKLIP